MKLSLTAKVNIGKTISAIVLAIVLSIGSYYNGQVHTHSSETANSEIRN